MIFAGHCYFNLFICFSFKRVPFGLYLLLLLRFHQWHVWLIAFYRLVLILIFFLDTHYFESKWYASARFLLNIY